MLTVCHVEESKDSNECNDNRAGCCRVWVDGPSDRLRELGEPASQHAAQHDGAPIDATHEEHATQHTKKSHARHHEREAKWVLNASNFEVIRRVNINP